MNPGRRPDADLDKTEMLLPESQTLLPSLDLQEGSRFVFEQHLGSGSFGAVHAAFDRKRNARVAVKVLSRAEPGALVRFKREFRALSDLSHPNLINMYELVHVEGRWLFTMELIDGVDFLSYVREGPERLVNATRQLALGLRALHQAGMLHRDLKPSNVLVTPAGRVVILDFGLVTESDPGLEEGRTIAGTPGYWAPEQMSGAGAVEASDWYSVGIMLQQALTKVAGAPLMLEELTQDLLRPDPRQRPGGAEVLARLPAHELTAEAERSVPASLFVGRKSELEILHGAFRRSRDKPAIVLLHGPSGIGKSAIIMRFLQQAKAQLTDLVVLSGRCYERETVPYRALDSLIDSIAAHLKKLSFGEADGLMPRDIATLAEVFPVLREIPAVTRSRGRRSDSTDVQERRRRAFRALKDLLARIGDSRPLVIVIDDLQWGDLDSLGPLTSLVSPPDAPMVLFVASYRTEEGRTSPLLRGLLPAWRSLTPDITLVEVELGELARAEAIELARSMTSGPASAASLDLAASEAGGHPLWICELMRRGPGRDGRVHGLDDLLIERISRLPDPARRFLEVLAVAGAPVARDIVHIAAGLSDDEPALTALLCNEHLARVRAGGEIETYHDRIRESVVASLTAADAKQDHLALALALENRGLAADYERLATHFALGGDADRAAHYAFIAADAAVKTLAFDAAARLLRLALRRPGPDGLARLILFKKLGDALSFAGRGEEAAQAFLEGANVAPTAVEQLDLRRRAAAQLLAVGKIDAGLAVLSDVLKPVGMTLNTGPVKAMVVFLWWRFRLKIRGLAFRERAARDIPVDDLLKVDASATVGVGLASVDPVQALAFAPRTLFMALRCGEPSRISQALAVLAGFESFRGSQSSGDAGRFLAESIRLSRSTGKVDDRAVAESMAAVVDFFRGDWLKSRVRLPELHLLWEQTRSGNSNESASSWALQATMFVFTVEAALHMLGEFQGLSESVPQMIRDASERDDQYTMACFRNRLLPFVHLAAGQPELARSDLKQGITGWSTRSFHVQHYYNAYGQAEVDLYEGRPEAAWERMQSMWPQITGSFLTRFQLLWIEARHLRARAAVWIALRGVNRDAMLADAARQVKDIERERSAWGDALVALIRAGIAWATNDTNAADRAYAVAEQQLAGANMKHYLAACRASRAKIHGADLPPSVAEYCAAQGIADPEPFLRALVPGPLSRE